MRLAPAVFVAMLISATSAAVGAAESAAPVPGAAPGPTHVRFDPAAFRSLPDADKLAFVVAKLKARESELSNLSYKLEQTNVNVRIRGGKGSHHLDPHAWEYRRLGSSYRMKRLDYHSDPPALFVREAWLVTFDGTVSKRLRDPEDPAGQQGCVITPGQDKLISTCQFDRVLGFHAMPAFREEPVSLIDWLTNPGNADRKVAVTPDEFNLAPAIHLSVTEGETHWDYWLDPARDFMIERMNYKWQHGAAYNSASNEVQSASRVAGVWVADKALCISGTSAADEETHMTFTAVQMQVGQVREQDLKIEIPRTAKIYDDVRNIAYEPLPDGTFRLLPTRDTQGLLHVPPADPIVKQIDDETAKRYTVKDDLTTQMLNRH